MEIRREVSNKSTKPDATISQFYDVYVQLKMFRASSCPSSGAQQLQQQPLDNRPDHDQQRCYHHAPTVKPESATTVIELLMMGVRTPETCLSRT
jgi:hypothetical protein